MSVDSILIKILKSLKICLVAFVKFYFTGQSKQNWEMVTSVCARTKDPD